MNRYQVPLPPKVITLEKLYFVMNMSEEEKEYIIALDKKSKEIKEELKKEEYQLFDDID